MLPEPLLVVRIMVRIFESLNISYLVGGSVASSIHGIYRSTNDVDFVADIKIEDVDLLVAAMSSEFYVDADMIREAIETQSSFNVLHLPTMVKVDIFLFKPIPWKMEEWARRRVEVIGSEDNSVEILVASPEDMVLQKLVWFRLGGGVSDRQWSDIIGILKVQAEKLDYAYLRRWAEELDLSELLQKALEDAGIEA
jgi:hypothetical protein